MKNSKFMARTSEPGQEKIGKTFLPKGWSFGLLRDHSIAS